MPSLVYNSCIRDAVVGLIKFDTDTFKAVLVTSSYAASKAHSRRSPDVTNEVTGTGYTPGGNACTVSVAATDNSFNDVEISFTIANWTSATITARGAVIYKSTGTPSADPLVGYVDFLSDISSTNGTFAVTVSTPLKFQN